MWEAGQYSCALLLLRFKTELHLYSSNSSNRPASDWTTGQSHDVAHGVKLAHVAYHSRDVALYHAYSPDFFVPNNEVWSGLALAIQVTEMIKQRYMEYLFMNLVHCHYYVGANYCYLETAFIVFLASVVSLLLSPSFIFYTWTTQSLPLCVIPKSISFISMSSFI